MPRREDETAEVAREDAKTGCLWEDKYYSAGAVVKMADGKCHTCERDASGFKWGAGLPCGAGGAAAETS